MSTPSQEIVRLLSEEARSLRSQGKRVAAEAVERVIAKFTGKPSWLGDVGKVAELTRKPAEMPYWIAENESSISVDLVQFDQKLFDRVVKEGIGASKTISWMDEVSPHAGFGTGDVPTVNSELMLGVSLESIRCHLLRTKHDLFRVTDLHFSQKRIGADGISAEYEGRGVAEIFDTAEEGKRRAATEFHRFLPVPLEGYRRDMLHLEMPIFGDRESKTIRFTFRDVEVQNVPVEGGKGEKRLLQALRSMAPGDHSEVCSTPSLRQRAAQIWEQLKRECVLERPNPEQTVEEFLKQLAGILERSETILVWKVPSVSGGVLCVRVLPSPCSSNTVILPKDCLRFYKEGNS